jgi:phosphomannomutase
MDFNSEYKKWLTHPTIDTNVLRDLKKLKKDQIKSNFTNKLIFGTAGIRARMGPGTGALNLYTYRQIASGHAMFLKQKFGNKKISVLIGHDNRLNSDVYSMEVANVMSSYGFDVKIFIHNILMPTPIVSYAVAKMKCSSGLIVTASHNPKTDNGYKAYDSSGAQYMDEDTNAIIKEMENFKEVLDIKVTPNKNLISFIPESVINSYFDEVRMIQVNPKLDKSKISLTFSAQHGTASNLMPKLLTELGYNVIAVKEQCYPDPLFKNCSVINPEDSKAFRLSIKYANKHKCNIMMATDPDADRLAIAVRNGKKWDYLTGNQMGILYTYYNLTQKRVLKNSFIVSTFVSNDLIDRIADEFGAKVYRTSTGFKFLGNKIAELSKDGNLIVGFEEAIGANISSMNLDKDSFQCATLALEIINFYAQKGMTLNDVFEKEIFPKYGYWKGITLPVEFKGNNWRDLVAGKVEKLQKFSGKISEFKSVVETSYNKNYRLLEWKLNDGSWIKFRASGTEPKLKAYLNLYGSSTKALNKELLEISKLIKTLIIKK